MIIDWTKFAERVPKNTPVKRNPHTGAFFHLHSREGMLLERYPFRASDMTIQELSILPGWSTRDRTLFFQPFDLTEREFEAADNLLYFVNGKWQTFEEIMS